MVKFKKSKLYPFFQFFLKSYKISTIDKASLKETPIVLFRGYQFFIYFIYLTFILILVSFFLIAYGPLQKFLPQAVSFKKGELIELMLRVDSLQKNLHLKEQYIAVIDKIVSGENIDSLIVFNRDSSIVFENLDLTPSKEDSALRRLVTDEDLYNIPLSYKRSDSRLEDFVFFKPAEGLIISEFKTSEKHFGVDVVCNTDATVKATLDGVVIFSDWSVSGGHTILIQHAENIISLYMHNSSITKSNNDLVKAGEVIGVVGNTGESSVGPHLHFELWQNGVPINPLDYIDF